MQYIEIGQDIVDAIKGGAGYSGEDEATEIVGYISNFGEQFAAIISELKKIFEEFYNALKKYF